ncbi:MAG: DUF4388 domain-containing protein [Planctomycetota bacterium]|jgi:chromosome segregation ATPase
MAVGKNFRKNLLKEKTTILDGIGQIRSALLDERDLNEQIEALENDNRKLAEMVEVLKEKLNASTGQNLRESKAEKEKQALERDINTFKLHFENEKRSRMETEEKYSNLRKEVEEEAVKLKIDEKKAKKYAREKSNFTREKKALLSERDFLEKERAELERANNELQDNAATADIEYENARKRVAAIETELVEMRSENEITEKKLAASESSRKILSKELADANEDIDQMETKVSQAAMQKDKLASLKAEKEKEKKKASGLREELREWEKKYRERIKEIGVLRKDAQSKKSLHAQAEADISKKEKQIRTASRKLDSLELENEELAKKVSALEEEIAPMEEAAQKAAMTMQRLGALEDELKLKSDEADALQQEKEGLEKKLQSSASDMEQLSTRIEANEKEKAEYEKKAGQLQKHIEKLLEDISEKDNEITSTLEKSQYKQENFIKEIQDVKSELDNASEKTEKLQKEVFEKAGRVGELEQANIQSQKMLEEIVAERNKALKQLAEETEEKAREINRITILMDQARRRLEKQSMVPNAATTQTSKPGESFVATEQMLGDLPASDFITEENSSDAKLQDQKPDFEKILLNNPQINPEIDVALSRYLASKHPDVKMGGTGDDGDTLSGSLDVLDLPDLIQAINLRQKTGIIELPEIDSKIEISDGQIMAVFNPECPGESDSGEDAFFLLVEKKPKNFRFLTRPISGTRNVSLQTTQLLFECMRRLDEKEKA